MASEQNLVKILVLTIILLFNEYSAQNILSNEENSDDTNREENLDRINLYNDKIDVAMNIKDSFKSKTRHNCIEEAKNKNVIRKRSIDKMYDNENSHVEIDNKMYTTTEINKEIVKTEVLSAGENNKTIEKNKTKEINITEVELCVGPVEYCNMSKEEYVQMILDYVYPHNYEWVLIATHTLVFIGGVVGNALVCVAVYRNHSMRTVTNYFIVNLAVADFMVILFCLPPTVLWDVTETWFFGSAMCKFILYFQSVSVSVSVLTLTFISVDRWYAICFPLRFKSTTGRAKAAIFVIWAISLTFNAPELIVLTSAPSIPLRFELKYLTQCIATWSQHSDLVWHIVKLVFIYTVPLLLMTVAYYQIVKVLWRSDKIPGQADTTKLAPAENTQLRSRRKAAKMLAAVVVMFAVCYFPVHLLSVLRYTFDMEQNEAVTVFALISHVLCYANSAINPLIYNFMSGKFRREFRRAFCCTVAPPLENTTTLTRLTTCKKKPSELVALGSKRSNQGYVCQTTLF